MKNKIDIHKEAAKHHNEAAKFLEKAAKHHFNASKHYKSGNLEKARNSAVKANVYYSNASEFQQEILLHNASIE